MKKNNIEITNEDIELAEKILLTKGGEFDIERRDFIKNLDTIDLEAVPGSGKTTAILAKLLILERKMPFENGSGILVLSHTNTAVDEIKHKLEKIAPKLFKFPNFIGTIQSFVDTFLAKPYGVSFLNIHFRNIDDDYYNSRIEFEYKKLSFTVKSYIDKRKEPIKFLQNIFLDGGGNLLENINGKMFLKNTSSSVSYRTIFDIKNNLRNNGVITFREAYYFGFSYIENFPKIIKILQNRFQYVFVDEMQDMEQYQVDILEKLFYQKQTINHCFQRIGDKNQAIYSSVNSESFTDASGKRKILKIEGSHRLTESIANVVNCFSIEGDAKTIGKNKIPNGDIKPIMIVYDDKDLNSETSGENKILQKFGEIILEKQKLGYFEGIDSEKFICKAIISNAKMQDTGFKQDKCRAKHYFWEYDENFGKNKKSSWLKSEKDYLFYYDKNDGSLNSKYKNILKLFFRVLRKNNIENFYRKEQLFGFLEKEFPDNLLEFKDKLLYFCKNLDDTNIDKIAQEMDAFFKDFIKNVFNENIEPGIFNSKITASTMPKNKEIKTNIFKYNGLEIPICTTHSVKGETHTCTLYMESSNKYYEIEQIEEIMFLGGIHKSLTPTGKKFSKLIYVGFSRPTHLLCFVIGKERYNKFLKANEDNLKEFWEIKNI